MVNFKMETVYFIGNGINRTLGSGKSWSDILSNFAKEVEFETNQLEQIPFPLLFQRLAAAWWKKDKTTSRALREKVADKIKVIKPGELHKKIMARKIHNVLTTNYDFSLEDAIGKHNPCNSGWEISSKYSLFRHRVIKDKRIWHLHGDICEPRSILLGYDHYTGAIYRLRRYIYHKYHKRASLAERNIFEFEKSGKYYSWLDIFLRDNVHIIGLSLDYSEIDIWWAIVHKNHRARHNKYVGSTYYWAIDSNRSIVDESKYALLESLGVVVKYIDVINNDWNAAWEHAITLLPPT